MLDSAAMPPGNKPKTKMTSADLGWILLIVASLYVGYFNHLGTLGFVGPDEPRYAWVAREMAESGDWVTPRLYGKPWFEKPVLYYWSAALSFRIFGVSERSARLPSAAAALLATLALGWLARRLFGRGTALSVLGRVCRMRILHSILCSTPHARFSRPKLSAVGDLSAKKKFSKWNIGIWNRPSSRKIKNLPDFTERLRS